MVGTRATPVIVDASLAVQWFSLEDGSDAAARLLGGNVVLVAPDIMPVEAASAWHRKSGAGEMDHGDVHVAVSRLMSIGIDLLSSLSLLGEAVRLAQTLRHPLPDCLYLAAAALRGAELATADKLLQRAARRLNIPIWGT